jgi:hypothetical protein
MTNYYGECYQRSAICVVILYWLLFSLETDLINMHDIGSNTYALMLFLSPLAISHQSVFSTMAEITIHQQHTVTSTILFVSLTRRGKHSMTRHLHMESPVFGECQ